MAFLADHGRQGGNLLSLLPMEVREQIWYLVLSETSYVLEFEPRHTGLSETIYEFAPINSKYWSSVHILKSHLLL